MPAPKSVTKVTKSKDGNVTVTFTNSVARTNYYMFELCRGALRDVAKFVKKQFDSDFYGQFEKHTGRAGKAARSTVYSSKSTLYPRVSIGLKANKVGSDGHAYFQEVGTSKQPRRGIMAKVVESNVSTIIAIEGQYLSRLSAETPTTGISEGDVEID